MTDGAIEGAAFSAAADVADAGAAFVLAGVALGATVAEVELVLVLTVAGAGAAGAGAGAAGAGAAAAGVDGAAAETGAAGGFLGYDKN